MDDFRLYTGGPFPLTVPGGRGRVASPGRIWAGAILLWLPLPISLLTAESSAALQSGLLTQYLPDHVRFLVTLPLLIYAGRVVDQRISAVVPHFLATDAPPRSGLARALSRARWARDSRWINASLLLVALTFLIGRVARLNAQTEWPPFHDLWSSWVGVSVTQAFVLIWAARTVIWTYLLWVFSRNDPRILPTHPDGKGGLDFLNWVQLSYSWMVLGFAALLVAELLGASGGFDRATLVHTLKLLGAFLLLVLALFLGPLIFFSPPLCRIKRLRMMDHDRFSDRCVEEYERKWIRSKSQSPPLSSDISAVCDLIDADKQARRMAVVVPDLATIRRFALFSILPLAPVFVTQIPMKIWVTIAEKLLIGRSG